MKYTSLGLLFSLLFVSAEGWAQNPTGAKPGARVAIGRAVNVNGRVLVRGLATADAREGVRTEELKTGTELFEGDTINTSSDSSVKVLFNDKTIIDIGPSSLFRVDDFKMQAGNVANRNVDLSMTYGKLRASITQKLGEKGNFKLKTKTATMGVRGTEFAVADAILSDLGGGDEKKGPGRPESGNAGGGGANSGGSSAKITVIKGEVAVAKAPSNPAAKANLDKAVVVKTGQEVSVTKPSEEKGRETASAKPVEMKVVDVPPSRIAEVKQETAIVDKTFVAAIDSSAAGSSGGATMDIISGDMGSIELPKIDAGDMGFAGTFSPGDNVNSAWTPDGYTNQARITVRFHTQ